MCHHKNISAAGDTLKPVSHKLKYKNMFILPPFKIIWKLDFPDLETLDLPVLGERGYIPSSIR